MIKLLIVDDEPLVQVGLQSMINWHEQQIEVCGTASNGETALTLIEEHSPEIVISDIKMPVMDGLTLAKVCKDRYGNFPLFIILTSHEDFHLIKEALQYEIIDYLIKLDLTAEILTASVQKATKLVLEKKPLPSSTNTADFQFYYDKFFISLLHNLFQNKNQFIQLSDYLHIDFSYQSYAVCQCSFTAPQHNLPTAQKLMAVYKSSLQMLKELLPKYLPCYVFSMGLDTFCIIACFHSNQESPNIYLLKNSLSAVTRIIYTYFNISIFTSIGRTTASPQKFSESYQDARQVHSCATLKNPLVFYPELLTSRQTSGTNTFNISLFKESLHRSFEEYDATALFETLTSIIELFREHPSNHLQAMDAACNILYLSLSLLPDSESALTKIFKNYPDSYQSIYKQNTLSDILRWLEHLRDGLCNLLSTLQKKHSNKMMLHIKQYIDEHIEEKLTLIDVASVFNITPNYLSLLFKKHSILGFSEYVSQKKIAYAKMLLDAGQLKIYEIAHQLGFESAFYFSKVFKKVEGCSPRDYKQYQ